MAVPEVEIRFVPHGKTVRVARGTRLLEAIANAGFRLDLPCGGEGTCGKCRVVARGHLSPPSQVEQELLDAQQRRQGVRLACSTAATGSVEIEIPDSSLLPTDYQILAEPTATDVPVSDPPVHKQFVALPPPDRDRPQADLLRLEESVGPFEVDLDLVRELPDLLRAEQFRGTVVMGEGRLLDFQPGDAATPTLAVAVDLGTTTLAATLLDVTTGEPLAVVSRLNPQTSFGDDVLSRILFAREQDDGPEQLQLAVVQAIDAMLDELTAQAEIDRRDILLATFSGNTTMQQLFCRIETRPLGHVPFVPAAGRPLELPAAELGIPIHPRGRAFVMPTIGGFVGGDTVAGVLATGLDRHAGPALLVDIGTNGEIVLCVDGQLQAAATAAGPAFEGARISQGMRASAGAIERVEFDGQLTCEVIGGAAPTGICGSALIDAAAELLRSGLLTNDGRLLAADQLPTTVGDDLARRLAPDGKLVDFLLVDGAQSGSGVPILLRQRDLRELQLATGAIRAGIGILLGRAGLTPADLETVLVAGGFGNFIRRHNAQQIGLLPHEIDTDRIRYQGNTSLAGAQMVAVSCAARQRADALARRCRHVDLSHDRDFHAAFADAMIFPPPQT